MKDLTCKNLLYLKKNGYTQGADFVIYLVLGSGLEFKDGTNQAVEHTYDKKIIRFKDLNKNFSNIGYNF